MSIIIIDTLQKFIDLCSLNVNGNEKINSKNPAIIEIECDLDLTSPNWLNIFPCTPSSGGIAAIIRCPYIEEIRGHNHTILFKAYENENNIFFWSFLNRWHHDEEIYISDLTIKLDLYLPYTILGLTNWTGVFASNVDIEGYIVGPNAGPYDVSDLSFHPSRYVNIFSHGTFHNCTFTGTIISPELKIFNGASIDCACYSTGNDYILSRNPSIGGSLRCSFIGNILPYILRFPSENVVDIKAQFPSPGGVQCFYYIQNKLYNEDWDTRPVDDFNTNDFCTNNSNAIMFFNNNFNFDIFKKYCLVSLKGRGWPVIAGVFSTPKADTTVYESPGHFRDAQTFYPIEITGVTFSVSTNYDNLPYKNPEDGDYNEEGHGIGDFYNNTTVHDNSHSILYRRPLGDTAGQNYIRIAHDKDIRESYSKEISISQPQYTYSGPGVETWPYASMPCSTVEAGGYISAEIPLMYWMTSQTILDLSFTWNIDFEYVQDKYSLTFSEIKDAKLLYGKCIWEYDDVVSPFPYIHKPLKTRTWPLNKGKIYLKSPLKTPLGWTVIPPQEIYTKGHVILNSALAYCPVFVFKKMSNEIIIYDTTDRRKDRWGICQ